MVVGFLSQQFREIFLMLPRPFFLESGIQRRKVCWKSSTEQNHWFDMGVTKKSPKAEPDQPSRRCRPNKSQVIRYPWSVVRSDFYYVTDRPQRRAFPPPLVEGITWDPIQKMHPLVPKGLSTGNLLAQTSQRDSYIFLPICTFLSLFFFMRLCEFLPAPSSNHEIKSNTELTSAQNTDFIESFL